MEVGEKDREKVQSQVPWTPSTPLKPIVHRPVPIYTPGEKIQLGSHAYGVPTATENINNTRKQHWPGHGAAVTNIASDTATNSVRLAFDNFPSSSNSFAELLAQAQAPSTHCYNGIHDAFLQNQFVPTLSSQFSPTYTLLGHRPLFCEQPLYNGIHHNYQDPQGTSYFAYYDKTASHIAPPAPDNAIRAENTQDTGMPLHMGEKDQFREEKKVQNAEQNTESAHNKEVCDPITEFAAVSTQSTENHNDKEISQHVDLNKTPQQKPRRRKHRPKVIKEDKPTRNRKPVTPKTVQSKENATGRRKNVRKKESNTTSPQTETTGECTKPLMSESAKKTCRRSLKFDIGEQQRDVNSACRESGAAVTETQAANNEETPTPSTPFLKGNPPWAKANTNSDAGISTIGIQVVGSKRKHSGTIDQEDGSSINLTGVQYNILQAHCPEFWVQFPNIQKKRRSEKGRNSKACNTSSMIATKDVQEVTCPREDARSSPYESSSNFWTSGSEYNAVRVPVVITATDRAIHHKPQSLECNLSSGQRQTKRRSRVPTAKTCVDAERQQTGIDALVAEMRATLTKKKRTKKRSTLVSAAYSCTNEMQQYHKFVLENHSLLLHNSSDVVCKETWYNADALTVQFGQLNINTETRELVLHGQNAIVPYNQHNPKHKGLANGGTIIPYQGMFDPIKKQRPRPKVDLDEETNRVWKLLMLDINSHGVDGMDEDKAKWWEEERNVFRGRADSFIARMHLVQGDRRFTKWKGSVVDSVIGVFLTQNVSDHLSSSAFMSLAARFPIKSSSKYKTCHEESAGLIVNKPQVYIVESEESTKLDQKLLNPSVYDLSSMTTIDIIEHSEHKEAVDSNDSCRTSGSLTSLTDESSLKLSESTQRHIGEQHSPIESGPISAMTGEGQENSCDGGVGKELNDMMSSQCSVITSQIHADFSVDLSTQKIQSCSESNSEVEDLSSAAKFNIFCDRTSFSKLLEMASSTTLHEVNSQRSKSTENFGDVSGQPITMKRGNQTENLEKLDVSRNLEASIIPCDEYPSKMIPNSGVSDINCYDPFKIEGSSRGFSKKKDGNDMKRPSFPTSESETQAATAHSQSMVYECHLQHQSNNGQQNALHISGQMQDIMQKAGELDSGDQQNAINENGKIKSAPTKSKSRERQKEKKDDFDWDSLRIQAEAQAGKREKTENTMDSLDWDAVRLADVNEIADAIKERGMNNMLAERIKNFLNLLVDKHGAIDLEWLRDVPPDRAKEYLLSIRGLGLKSVECVRLLTLHHLAFPVDTNVGRIAVRLGWVPLQPLPESLQLHLLELYPVLESIQKYLWPRLCKLDQRTLYELHYQLITFGKVFCTKHKPNCNACPMRGECRHFASAFASARLALPGPEQRSIVITNEKKAANQNPSVIINQLPLPLPANTNQAAQFQQLQQIIEVSKQLEARSEIKICQPIIEEPASPEPECSQLLESDMEDAFCEEPGEIPAIKIDIEGFNLNVQNVMEENMELQESEMSMALVALTPEAACIPTPKLKNINRLRTEHWVYELPDSHRLLEGWDKREPDDPGRYLLAIWTPGETANSTQPPERKCSSQDCGQLCDEKECFSCNSYREANSQIVRGTILIPCRTAMRGSFPLNGTYFQVNEVFADNESSLNPIHVPRSWIWNLRRRTVYFGTSIPSIFKGLTTPEIQRCFWRGYVCVRGFDRETRAPRPLKARLHFPASKLAKNEPAPSRPQELNLNLQPNPELLSSVPNNEEKQGA